MNTTDVTYQKQKRIYVYIGMYRNKKNKTTHGKDGSRVRKGSKREKAKRSYDCDEIEKDEQFFFNARSHF